MTLHNNIDNEKAAERQDNEKSFFQLAKEDNKSNSNSNSNDQFSNSYDINLQSIRNDTGIFTPKALEEKTIVVYGENKTTELIVQTLNNAKIRWDNYADSQGPTIAMGVEQLRKGMRHAYERGVKIKYLTEITNHNINYCKELMKIAEVRHVDNAKGGMAVSEGEYIATAKLQEAKPVSHLIYSNVREIVEQQHHVFKSLWVNAISAIQRIREIENGHKRIETKVLDDQDEINNKIRSLSNENDEILICSDSSLLKIVHECYFSVYQEIMEKYDKGNHKGVRWITDLSCKEDINVAKLFVDLGIKIRSVRNLPPLNFLVTDQVFFSNVEKIDRHEDRKIIKQLFTTNDVLYIHQYQITFEELWRNGIDATDIIEDIERGLDPERVDIIQRSNNAEIEYLDLLKSAHREIMLLLPTVNALQRQWELGVFELIAQAAIHRNVKTRVLIPSNKKTEILMERIQRQSLSINNLNSNINTVIENISVRSIQKLTETRSTILIVDKKVSLVMELKDDSKEKFHEAIGISTYSNSKAGVLSYVSIFETLWNQTELYQQLKKSEDLQKDFIRIAAHELRSPIQPILLTSEMLKSTINSKEWETCLQLQSSRREINEYVDSIIRNTKKVVSLTNSILDITRIETNTLILRKEIVDLRLFLLEQMLEYEIQHTGKIETTDLQTMRLINKCRPRLDYSQLKGDLMCGSLLADLDKSRISQVIYNLLDNAFKFTNGGDTIHITLSKEYLNGRQYAVVSIRDSGKGIDRDILSRLFTKFTTRSEKGVGLGLFITKSIIEAHGGCIWASNNVNTTGATFSFTLPCNT